MATIELRLSKRIQKETGRTEIMIRFFHYHVDIYAKSGSADLAGWYVRQIKNKVVPLQHGTYQAASCHPARGTNRQLRGCEF